MSEDQEQTGASQGVSRDGLAAMAIMLVAIALIAFVIASLV